MLFVGTYIVRNRDNFSFGTSAHALRSSRQVRGVQQVGSGATMGLFSFGKKQQQPQESTEEIAAKKAAEAKRLADEINAKLRSSETEKKHNSFKKEAKEHEQKHIHRRNSGHTRYRSSIFGSALGSEAEKINKMIAEKKAKADGGAPPQQQQQSPPRRAQTAPRPRQKTKRGSIWANLGPSGIRASTRARREQSLVKRQVTTNAPSALPDATTEEEGEEAPVPKRASTVNFTINEVATSEAGPAGGSAALSGSHSMLAVLKELLEVQRWVNKDANPAKWGEARTQEFVDKLQVLASSAKTAAAESPAQPQPQVSNDAGVMEKFVADVGSFSRRLFQPPPAGERVSSVDV